MSPFTRMVTLGLLVTLACVLPVHAYCPRYYERRGSSNWCYRFVQPPASKPFAGARTNCVNQGGDLLSIQNQFEANWITQQLVLRNRTDNVRNWWTGLLKLNGSWTFTDGRPFRQSLAPWVPGEPKNNTRATCAKVTLTGMVAIACGSNKLGYICKRHVIPYYCDDGWQRVGDKCIYYNETELTWPLARQTCQRQGGDLVKISTLEDNDFVTSNLDRDYFIGLHRRNNLGNFTWLDETIIPTFYNWAPGEPNDFDDSEACVQIWGRPGQGDERLGVWNDIACGRREAFICDKPAYIRGTTPPASTILTPDWTEKCGPGWEHQIGTDWCYSFMNEFVSWGDGRDTCRDFGGELASILSPEEQTYLTGRVRERLDGAMWIGINDLAEPKRWMWVDRSPLPYFSWGEGWPDGGATDSRHCGVYMLRTNKWESRECNSRFTFICKKRGDVPMPTDPPEVTQRPGFEYRCNDGNDWVEYGNACYKFAVNPRKTWDFARFQCIARNSDLVSIHSQDEMDFVFANVKENAGNISTNPLNAVWIGLQDFRGRHYYQWSDRSEVVYTNWESGEPNNWLGNHGGCAEMKIESGRWNNEECSKNSNWALGWVCKHMKRERFVVVPTTKAPIARCPIGTDNVYRGNCLMYVRQTERTFDDARRDCQDWAVGGDLVDISDKFTNAFLLTRLPKDDGRYWIGYSNRGNDDGHWSWVNGAVSKNDYTNWGSHFTGKERESMAAMITTGNRNHGMWVAETNSNAKRKYVCKVRKSGMRTPPSPPTSSPPVCEVGWKENGDNCYKEGYPSRGNDLMKHTWAEALFNCRRQEADLASIHSLEDNDFIRTRMERPFNGDPKWWIGLHNNTVSGQQEWSDGDGVSYTWWKDGQPDSHNGEENCVRFDFSDGGRWEYQNCDTLANWVCKKKKWDPPAPSITPPMPTEGLAGPNPTTVEPFPPGCRQEGYVNYLGQCYKLMTSVASWDYQVSACRQDNGGDLASLHTWSESAFVVFFFRQTKGPIWIGLNDKKTRGKFTWSNNWFVNFTNWSPGQPSSDENKRCVSVQDNGGWVLNSCNDRYPAICKIPLEAAPSPHSLLPSQCPDGPWVDFHMGCYDIADGDSQGFAASSLECASRGGNLISIHDQFENFFIFQRIINQNIRRRLWLGMTRPTGDAGVWRWTDGSPLQYVNWAPGEPSDPDGTHENCVEMIAETGLWNDVACSTINKVACKTDKEIFSPIPTALRSGILTSTQGSRPTRPGLGKTIYIGQPVPSTTPPPINRNTGLSNEAKVGIAFGVLIGMMVIVLVVLVINKHRDQLPSALRKGIMKDRTAGFSNSMYFSQESLDRPESQTSGSTGVQMQIPPAIDSNDVTASTNVPTLEVSLGGDWDSSCA